MKFLLSQKGIRADYRDSTGISIAFDFNSTPLHAAARFNHVEICQLLLNIENVDVNYQDEIFINILNDVQLFFPFKWRFIEICRFNWTPLHYAARNAHIHVVELLLKHPKINVNIADKRIKCFAFKWNFFF